jgi:RNA polymerase sigma-70 factor (ECF subfamily)
MLMDIHQDYVYSLAFRFVRNRETAEEITQDVFIKVFKNIHAFKEKSRITTWLYTIVYRTSINYLDRKKIVFNESSGEPGADDHERLLNDQVYDGVFSGEKQDLQEILWRAVDRLPVLQGVIILLYYMNQFTVAEIAEIIQSPPNTVKTHLHRGRNQLKIILSRDYSLEELI